MDKMVRMLKALADKNRLRILKLLEQKPFCVCELTSVLGIAQSSTSEHLKILKEAELIFDDKNGYWVNYRINKKARAAKPFLKCLKKEKIIINDRIRSKKTDREDLFRKKVK